MSIHENYAHKSFIALFLFTLERTLYSANMTKGSVVVLDSAIPNLLPFFEAQEFSCFNWAPGQPGQTNLVKC